MDFPTAKSATNQGWFTDPEVADPKDLPIIKAWRVLVRPIPNAPKSKGGIIIPDATLDAIDMIRSVGRVVAMGPLAYKRQDMWVDDKYDPWCKVGDFVLYPKYGGAKFSYHGVKFLLINDDEVLATLADPGALNE